MTRYQQQQFGLFVIAHIARPAPSNRHYMLLSVPRIAITRLTRPALQHSPSPAHSYSTQRAASTRPKMSMSLEYTPDRRAELEENIKAVKADMPGKVRAPSLTMGLRRRCRKGTRPDMRRILTTTRPDSSLSPSSSLQVTSKRCMMRDTAILARTISKS